MTALLLLQSETKNEEKHLEGREIAGFIPRCAQEQIPGGARGWAAESQPAWEAGDGNNHGIHRAGLQHQKRELTAT